MDNTFAIYRWIVGVGLACLLYFGPTAPAWGSSYQEPASRHQATLDRLDELESEVSLGNILLGKLDQDITQTSARLVVAQSELSLTTREVEAKQDILLERLRGIYKQSDVLALELLLSSSDISEFIAAVAFLARIADADARLIASLKKQQEHKVALTEELAVRKAGLVEQRRQRQELVGLVKTKIAQEETVLARLNRELGFAQGEPAGRTARAIPAKRTLFGHASWYGNQFHGRRTANGEVFNQNAFTAASPSLPFGTLLRVTFGPRVVVVRINDRGPFVRGRVLDLSRAAARSLGLGVGYVRMEVLRHPG